MTIQGSDHDALLSVLAEIKEARGDLPGAAAKQAAHILGCSERTIYRRMSRLTAEAAPSSLDPSSTDEVDARAPAYRLDEHAVDVLYANRGRPMLAYKQLKDEGNIDVSLRTFQRGIAALDAEIRIGAKGSWRAVRAARGYFHSDPGPKGSTYEIDHTGLPVLVLPNKREGEPFTPNGTHVYDLSTHLLLVAAVSDMAPDAGFTAAVMATAIRGHHITIADDDSAELPPGSYFIGGQPDRIRTDNGADLVLQGEALARLGVLHLRTAPKSPHQNGGVERVHRTIVEQLAGYPGYVDPRLPGFEQKSMTSDWRARQDELLTLDQFKAIYAVTVTNYNLSPVRALGKRSPLAAWIADPRELPQIDDRRLFLHMLREDDAECVYGFINWDKKRFWIEALQGEKSKVQVRYLPGRTEVLQLEVFRSGLHLGTAHREDQLTREEIGRELGRRQASETIILAHRAAGDALSATHTREVLAGLGVDSEAPALPTRTQAGNGNAAPTTGADTETHGGPSAAAIKAARALANKWSVRADSAAPDEVTSD